MDGRVGMSYTQEVKKILDGAMNIALKSGHAELTIMHVIMAMFRNERFKESYKERGGTEDIFSILRSKLRTSCEVIEDDFISTLPNEKYLDVLLKFAARHLKTILKDNNKICLSELFLLMFSDSPAFDGSETLIYCEPKRGDKPLLKDMIYLDLLTAEKGEELSSVNVIDIALTDDFNVETLQRPVGTFGEAYKKRKKLEKVEAGNAEKIPAGQWQNYVKNINQVAESMDKPLIGRDYEIERSIEILLKKEKANPVLVGEAGVGKSAIVMGLAKRIINGDVPESMVGSKVYELNTTALMAGTVYRGMLEDRVKSVLEGLSKIKKPILFIDELHMLIGSGKGGGDSMDIANLLKTSLTDGKIKFIGATTYDEYRKYVEEDPAFKRRFSSVNVKEPKVNECVEILKGLRDYYQDYHNVTFTDEALVAAAEMSDKFIHDRFLPDKAIDLVDEAGAWINLHPENGSVVTPEIIEKTIAKTCGVPENALPSNDKSVLKNLSNNLRERVFGQPDAIKKVSDVIKIAKVGLRNDEKPIGCFLFVGPSGVGKTELAKQLANTLGIEFVRFDMSEYAEKFSVSKLFGTSAGFVGYENGGLLTNAVSKNPHCVLLFDEIEKADKDVFKTFLQIMDYGVLTDSHGKKVDFKNTIIIMTSNCGIEQISKPSIGFGSHSINMSAIDEAVNETFTVEFRNRLTAILKFNSLSTVAAMSVVNKELAILSDKLSKLGYSVQFTSSCKDEILKSGVSEAYGAREVQRVIEQNIKKILMENMLDDELPKNFVLDYKNGEYCVSESAETITEISEVSIAAIGD